MVQGRVGLNCTRPPPGSGLAVSALTLALVATEFVRNLFEAPEYLAAELHVLWGREAMWDVCPPS